MKIILAAALVLAAPAAAQTNQTQSAQTQSAQPQSSPLGGLSGLLGGALPSVASAGAGNAAGVLGYCVKNNVLSGANATSVLERLTGKPGVTAEPGYAAGQAGTVGSGRSALSLKSLKGQLRTRVCDMVLKRAGAFL